MERKHRLIFTDCDTQVRAQCSCGWWLAQGADQVGAADKVLVEWRDHREGHDIVPVDVLGWPSGRSRWQRFVDRWDTDLTLATALALATATIGALVYGWPK